jgi:hypothetical protein
MKKFDRYDESVCRSRNDPATIERLRGPISETKWELLPRRNERLDKMPLLGHKQAQR